MNRLRRVSDILRHDEQVEADSSECPGLAALAASLVSDFLEHKDKEVRLYTVLCCMEIFSLVRQSPPATLRVGRRHCFCLWLLAWLDLCDWMRHRTQGRSLSPSICMFDFVFVISHQECLKIDTIFISPRYHENYARR